MTLAVVLWLSLLLLITDLAVSERTRSGCQCRENWSYNGLTFTGGQCGNPNNDFEVRWCFIKEGSCKALCFNEPYGEINGEAYDRCPDIEKELRIPGEMVGRWKGQRTANSVTDSQSLCAPETLSEFVTHLYRKPDASPVIRKISQVMCTDFNAGYFYADVDGNSQCFKFRLEEPTDKNGKRLVLKSHSEENPNDCTIIDQPGVNLIVESFRGQGDQVSQDMFLCRPRLPPKEVIGIWEGFKKMAIDSISEVTTECAAYLTITTNGWMVTSSETCVFAIDREDSLATEQRTDIIFDRYVDDCKGNGAAVTSTGTVMAYSTSGREYCYRFIRTGDSLKLSYQTARHPQQNHHACPDNVEVSKDVAVLDLKLSGGAVSSSEWLCNDPIPIIPQVKDDSTSDKIVDGSSTDTSTISNENTKSEAKENGNGIGMLVAFLVTLFALVTLSVYVLYKEKISKNNSESTGQDIPAMN